MEKKLECIVGSSVKEVVKKANLLNLQKDDIVYMIEIKDTIYLIYYK